VIPSDTSKSRTSSELPINRGVELLLGGRPKPQKAKPFEVRFGKMISFLNREMHFHFEVSFYIQKKETGDEK
jgi:hypothetical protein